MWLLALLPFRALYVLSDGFCFLMHHIVHYRRRVVRNNLRNAFPEKSEAELREIERKFYRYICDYMLEEVKMLRMSFKELCCRMEYDNKEEFLAMIERTGEAAAHPRILTYDDHRMAMAFAPAAIRFPSLTVLDAGVVSKSYPDYWRHLALAGFKMEVAK